MELVIYDDDDPVKVDPVKAVGDDPVKAVGWQLGVVEGLINTRGNIIIGQREDTPKIKQKLDAVPDATKTLREQYKAALGSGDVNDILFAQRVKTLADGLPAVTRGIISAKDAFDRGDAIGASAAIMDIIAAAAPGVGVLAALGPEGAVVGALFTVIGVIISAFAEKQPSVVQQITDVIQEINARDQTIKLQEISLAFKVAKLSLLTVYTTVPDLLANPVTNENEADEFGEKMRVVKGELDQLLKDHSIFAGWNAAAWLQNESNQSWKQWPELLGLWCRAYTDLAAFDGMLGCIINKAAFRRKLEYFHVGNNIPGLTEERKGPLRTLCEELESLAERLQTHRLASNRVALEVLEAVTPAAQRWGLIVRLDPGVHLYRQQLNHEDDLSDVKPAGLAIAREASKTYIKPRYHWFFLNDPDFSHWLISPDTPSNRVQSNDQGIAKTPGATDICAAQVGENQTALWVGTADGVWRHSWVTDPRTNTGKVTNSEEVFHTGWKVEYVRIAALPGLDQPAVYAGRSGTPDIRVNVKAWGKEGDVKCPWDWYSGIAADSRYVWVFHPGGFACATHTSVLRCVRDATPKPQWMEYRLPEGLQALRAMSPCDDGTICASIVFRGTRIGTTTSSGRSLPHEESVEEPRSYITTFTVDAKSRTLNVGAWTPIKDTHFNTYVRSFALHKLPIACWPLVESLKKQLRFVLPQAHLIQITATALPANTAIVAGDTVVWTNRTETAHTVTADNGSFESRPLAKDQSFAHVFDAQGVVGYHLKEHPETKGKVFVA